MLVAFESSFGSEYKMRVTLTTCDIEAIARKMRSEPDRLDGPAIALFLRTLAREAIMPSDSITSG